MLIIVVGPPCSGKKVLAHRLATEHGFTLVKLASASSSSSGNAASSSHSNELVFSSTSAFLGFATTHWKSDFVTTALTSRRVVEAFLKRPFVALVAVEAPLLVRWRRANTIQPGTKLDDFIADEDRVLYGPVPTLATLVPPPSTPQKRLSAGSPPSPVPSPPPPFLLAPSTERQEQAPTPTEEVPPQLPHDSEPLAPVLRLAPLVLPNLNTSTPFASLLTPDFFVNLAEQLRPSWDTYFMQLASLASLRSNCMKRRVGCVVVREHRVVSTGYNGTPRGVKNCNAGGCERCNSGSEGVWDQASKTAEEVEEAMRAMNVGNGQRLDTCLCLHAEENALLEAGRDRISGGGTEGAVLYCNTCPCLTCTVKIVQSGIKEVVYSLSYFMDQRSRKVMEEAGVVLRQFEMKRELS